MVKKKIPRPLVALAFLFLIVIIVYLNMQQPSVIHQESAYGISGKITAINGTSLTVTTPTLPIQNFVFDPLESWTWIVDIEKALVVRHLQSTENGSFEKELKNLSATHDDLKVGMSITITTENDFSSQFTVSEKRIRALEIKIYE